MSDTGTIDSDLVPEDSQADPCIVNQQQQQPHRGTIIKESQSDSDVDPQVTPNDPDIKINKRDKTSATVAVSSPKKRHAQSPIDDLPDNVAKHCKTKSGDTNKDEPRSGKGDQALDTELSLSLSGDFDPGEVLLSHGIDIFNNEDHRQELIEFCEMLIAAEM